jgi:hypothetical protein
VLQAQTAEQQEIAALKRRIIELESGLEAASSPKKKK